jgi:hypothetical protein
MNTCRDGREPETRAWDRQFETDVAAGRLDALAEEALADLRAGRTWPICNERPTAAARHLLP